MKNNKGFTMVELLVAMAIMGLLIIMAFPTIRAIQANNTKSNFEQFGKAVISASKLYVDSYGEDLFDLKTNYGNADITIMDLYKKDLINKTGLKESDCSNSKVFVLKLDNDYTYCLHLVCKNGGKVVYESNDKTKKKQCSDLETVNVNYEGNSEEKNDEIMKGTTNYVVKTPNYLGFTSPGSIKGWQGASDGKYYAFGASIAGPINSSITLKAVTNDDEDEEEEECTGANCPPPPPAGTHYVKIKINVNGAKLAASHGDAYTVKNGFVYKNNDIYVHKIPYGGKLSDAGLINYNSTKNLNLVYDYKHIDKNSSDYYLSWNTLANGKGTTFNQDTVYAASKFCDASKNDCEVTLYALWKDNTCTITYSPNGGKFNKHSNDTKQVLIHGQTVGGEENGMRNARGENGYYYATKKDKVVAAWAEWNTKTGGGGTGYDQDYQYDVEKICPNLKTKANTNVSLYVKWLDKTKQIRLMYMKYVKKNCNPSSGYPYRKYKFYTYRCTCVYKTTNSKLDTHKAYYMKHADNKTCGDSYDGVLYKDATESQLKNCFVTGATVKYRNTDKGKKACNNNGYNINQYVYQICAHKDLQKNKNVTFFHGIMWYWGEKGNFQPKIKGTEKYYKNYYSPKTQYWTLGNESTYSTEKDFEFLKYTIDIKEDSVTDANKYSYNKDKSNEVQTMCKNYCEEYYGDYRYGDEMVEMEEED